MNVDDLSNRDYILIIYMTCYVCSSLYLIVSCESTFPVNALYIYMQFVIYIYSQNIGLISPEIPYSTTQYFTSRKVTSVPRVKTKSFPEYTSAAGLPGQGDF